MLARLPSMTPVLATAGTGVVYCRRIRRQFGRQPWQPGARFWLRIALLSALTVGLLVVGFRLPHAAPGVLAGLVAGAVLGAFAIAHTRIEREGEARRYTPNPWIGGALSLLLAARLAWRVLGNGAPGDGLQAIGRPAAAVSPNTLTLAFAATLVVYYLVSSGGLAWRMRRPA